MIYVPEVQIHHAHKLTLQTFWRQHFNYGRGAFCFHQIRTYRSNDRIQVEPLAFYFRLLMYPFSQTSKHPAVLLMGLLLVSQVANVAGFFWERLQQTQPHLISFFNQRLT